MLPNFSPNAIPDTLLGRFPNYVSPCITERVTLYVAEYVTTGCIPRYGVRYLVFHERDERRHHKRQPEALPRHERPGKLIADGFPCPRRENACTRLPRQKFGHHSFLSETTMETRVMGGGGDGGGRWLGAPVGITPAHDSLTTSF